jgi:hypothetical protein
MLPLPLGIEPARRVFVTCLWDGLDGHNCLCVSVVGRVRGMHVSNADMSIYPSTSTI